MSAPSPATVSRVDLCPRCGDMAVASRGARAWHSYCPRCGHDWQEPAPLVVEKRAVQPLCRCGRVCRFCKKARRG